LERIEIEVASADEHPPEAKSVIDVARGWGTIDQLHVNAGEVLEVAASGEYRVSGQRAGPTGVIGLSSGRIADPLFGSANRGVAILVLGTHKRFRPEVIGECKKFLSPFAGPVLVSINNADPTTASGDISFRLKRRPPTRDEWLRGAVDERCDTLNKGPNGLEKNWASGASLIMQQFIATNAAIIAGAILQIAHPTGQSPQVGAINVQREGDGIAALIDVTWHGGFSGTQYTTRVAWSLNARRHILAVVEQDNAPFRVAKRNAEQLNEYFALQLYPRLLPGLPQAE
jgi:hypothetical protein